MKIKDLVIGIPIWRSHEEQSILDKLDQPLIYSSLEEREQFIAENLVRKNLVAKLVKGDLTYLYRNV